MISFKNRDLGADAVGSGTFSDRLSLMFIVRLASTLGLDTTTVNDAGSTRIVVLVTVSLIALGIGLGVLNFWFWRKTKPDPEALGPLVEMSSRKFAELELIEQRHRLDQLRPSLVASSTIEPLPVMQPPIPIEDEPQEVLPEIVEEVAINDIDWDDDEWPDVDDWSLPEEKARQQEIFDQDLEDELEIAQEVLNEQPKKGPVSIDPLLGF
ncbi:unannotated protein [freshwater metagenome]|uniref:Unannotated protein n=1 Tax=freshwater metagenome TaxID=449393 RepID=A0A6J6XWH6_9ZZZZ